MPREQKRDSLKDFLRGFHARRMAKHETETETEIGSEMETNTNAGANANTDTN
jgi:hypothetical protein